MTMKTTAAGWLLLALAGCAQDAPERANNEAQLAQAPYEPASLAIQCGTLIDGLGDEMRENVTVVIRNGRIAAVNAGFSNPADLPSLDLSGYTCLPGLIEMHDHMTESSEDTADMSVYLRRTNDEQWTLSTAQARATLLAGFTSVRNVGVYRSWADRDQR